MWQKIRHLRIEIMFIYEYGADTRQYCNYISIEQPIEEREERWVY